jgi:uncharacterized protein (UPF0264 family)
MTGLLVSVRDATEAAVALKAGAAIIDVKEPTRGSLGRPDAEAVRGVVTIVSDHVPVSVALGELRDWDETSTSIANSGVALAKIGLSGCAHDRDWPAQLARAIRAVRAPTTPVAVYYADAADAMSPALDEVLAVCQQTSLRWLLVDTFDKQRGNLLDIMQLDQLEQLAGACRRNALRLTLAGSLTADTIPRLLHLRPEFIGVRGAVCPDGRESSVEEMRVRRLVQLLECCSFPLPVPR